jgi:uncharacterized membrane protein YraQ (UPF0718 family)
LPFIALGAVIAGLLEEFLPPWLLTYLIPRNPFLAVGIGGLLGIVLPICECGIVPIMRRLLRKGLPLSCRVADLLAGPIVNIVVLLKHHGGVQRYGKRLSIAVVNPTYQMSNWWMTGFRAGLGYIVAVVTGLLVEWMWRKHGETLLTPVYYVPRICPWPTRTVTTFMRSGRYGNGSATSAKPLCMTLSILRFFSFSGRCWLPVLACS